MIELEKLQKRLEILCSFFQRSDAFDNYRKAKESLELLEDLRSIGETLTEKELLFLTGVVEVLEMDRKESIKSSRKRIIRVGDKE